MGASPIRKAKHLDVLYAMLKERDRPMTAEQMKQYLREITKQCPTTYELSSWVKRDPRFRKVGISSPILWRV